MGEKNCFREEKFITLSPSSADEGRPSSGVRQEDVSCDSHATGVGKEAMPSHAPASRPARSRTPSRQIVASKKDSSEELSGRATALSPNRSVASPAPGMGEEQASPYSRRDRVKKRVSDEAVGGIESLIPKARKQNPGPASPYTQRTTTSNNGTGRSPVGAATNGSTTNGFDMHADSPMAASKRGRKSSKTDSHAADSSVDEAPMTEIMLPSPVMPQADGTTTVIRSSPQKPVDTDAAGHTSQPKCALRLEEHMENKAPAIPINGEHAHSSNAHADVPANQRPALPSDGANGIRGINGYSQHNGKSANGDRILVIDYSEKQGIPHQNSQQQSNGDRGQAIKADSDHALCNHNGESSNCTPPSSTGTSQDITAPSSHGSIDEKATLLPIPAATHANGPIAAEQHGKQWSTENGSDADVNMSDGQPVEKSCDATPQSYGPAVGAHQDGLAASTLSAHRAEYVLQTTCTNNCVETGPASEGTSPPPSLMP